MSARILSALLAASVAAVCAAASANAQRPESSAASSGRAAPGYKPPRMANGQPDLSGSWTNAALTNLTRPAQFKWLTLTDKEHEDAVWVNPRARRVRTDDNLAATHGQPLGEQENAYAASGARGYNAFWHDYGATYGRVKETWRTSWIVEPTDGKIPYTEAGRKYVEAVRSNLGNGYDNPEERSVGERCVVGFSGVAGPPIMNTSYNNHLQFVQTSDYFVIELEMVHDVRIIPLRDTHLRNAPGTRFGNSIGRWEGDTLVVETIDVRPDGGNQAIITGQGKIIERFTRYSDKQILYEFEVHDPTLYTSAWKGEMSFNTGKGPVYEYACHEGNYGLWNILSGGRQNDLKGKPNVAPDDRREE